MATRSAYYQVRETFLGTLDDGTFVELHEGEVIDPDDPALKKWPERFKPFIPRVRPLVEQATAAPGEKRGA